VIRELLYSGEIPGSVQENGQVHVNLNVLTEWANKRRPQEWARIKFQGLRDVLGARGLGIEPAPRETSGGKKQPRRWFLKTLPECRKLWDEKFFPVTWTDDREEWEEIVQDEEKRRRNSRSGSQGSGEIPF